MIARYTNFPRGSIAAIVRAEKEQVPAFARVRNGSIYSMELQGYRKAEFCSPIVLTYPILIASDEYRILQRLMSKIIISVWLCGSWENYSLLAYSIFVV